MSPRSRAGEPVTILGAGAWGTVLAVVLARTGVRVRLWTHRPQQAEEMARSGENGPYLPGLALPSGVRPTADLGAALTDAQLAVVAVPSPAVRGLVRAVAGTPADTQPPVLVAAKGIVPEGFRRLSEVVEEECPGTAVAVLSGPNLAAEIAAGKPAAAIVASRHQELARGVQALLVPSPLRLYTGTDVVGVELAGALKNVIALAAGMSDGLALGDNSKASLITRGLAEMVRLGTQLGGDRRTFYGLAGVGDLVATCSSPQSRNHLAGERFARGSTLAEVEASHLTAEGIPTVLAVHRKASAMGLELPITDAVYRVIYRAEPAQEAIRQLMAREPKAE